MKNLRRLLICVMPLLLWAVPASSHHSFAVNFNTSGNAELRGVLTDIRIRNPHSLLEMDVVNENGETESWVIETHSVPLLARVDFTQDTFSVGEEIIVQGWPSRREGRRLVFGLAFVKLDGTVYVWDPADLVSEGGLASELGNVERVGRERFNAVWGYTADPNPHIEAVSPMPLTAAANAAREVYDPFNTTAMRCIPPNIPGMLYVPYLLGIEVEEDSVTIQHEYFDVVRRLPLSGGAAQTEPSGQFGTGSARFDGTNLVIETSGYPELESGMATSFDPNGVGADIPSSAQKEVTEVYSMSPDGQTLTIEYTITDPVYLSESYTAQTSLVRLAPGTEIVPFECDPEMAAETSAQDNI